MATFHDLMTQLASLDSAERESARAELLRMDEDVMDLLVAEFYAGMPEKLAISLIEIIGEIGGYEALNLLGDVYYSRDTRPALKAAARIALLRNADNLDPQQVAHLKEA
ncbi:MAG: hypothetical protein GC179_09725 [Anaerolineaceae bacterium]|nr:hypothetical protein [Anaerolineaceae bacterium]